MSSGFSAPKPEIYKIAESNICYKHKTTNDVNEWQNLAPPELKLKDAK